MNSKRIRQMVTTAILIALAIAFQNLRLVLGGSNPVSTYIVGTLVNICLIVGTCVVSLWSGLAIALITPLIALWQGHAQLPMVPWVIAGNAVLVLCYAIGIRKTNGGIGAKWVQWAIVGLLAAVLKYGVMLLGNAFVLSSKQGTALGLVIGTAAGLQIQQLITAALAMVIARLVIGALPARIKE